MPTESSLPETGGHAAPGPRGRASSRAQWIILGLFAAVNVLLALCAIPEAPQIAGGDTGIYLKAANQILQTLGLRPPLDPGTPATFMTPLYPILLAGLQIFLPWKPLLWVLVALQCLLLYATGLATREIAGRFAPSAATAAQCMVLFNPNSLITAQLMQTETLFTFLFTLAVARLLRFADTGRTSTALWSGLGIGLAALTRPVALYAIPLMIPALLILCPGNTKLRLASAFRAGIVATLLAALLVAPWFARNYMHFGEVFYTTNAGPYLHDQYAYLYRLANGVSLEEANKKTTDIIQLHMKAQGIANLDELNRHQQSRLMLEALKDDFLGLPLKGHLYALLTSWGHLYLTGGASNYVNYLGLKGTSQIVAFQQRPWEGATTVLTLLRHMPYAYFLIFGLTTATALALRALNVLGLAAAARSREQRGKLLLLVCVLLFFTAMYIYLGQSRFRVPLEPELAVLSALGLDALLAWRRRRASLSGRP